MESLPIDLTYLVVSKLDNPQDIINFKESNPTTEEHLNDLNRWNQLICSEMGPEYSINPAIIYTELKNRKKKVQEFMSSPSSIVGVDLDTLPRTSKRRILKWLISDHTVLLRYLGTSPWLSISPNGTWTLAPQRQLPIMEEPLHGTMDPSILEKMLLLLTYRLDL